MSSWINEPAVQNHNGNGFSHMNDPNAPPGGMPGLIDPSAFLNNPNASQFNPAAQGQYNPPMMAMQHPQQQQQQHRTASPSPFNPMYQTNQVIPSKRPRPRENSVAASPRQNSGMLPTSRAETPGHYGQPQPQPSQGQQHLPHNGSANATPSPIMANHIRSGSAVPQRVATTSPHPFSPANQQTYAAQASPAPSDHSQAPGQNPYVQGAAGNFTQQGFNPNFPQAPAGGRPSPSPQQGPGATGQMVPQHMGQMGQMGQMNPMGQMGQVPPGAMFTPQMQQQLAQARTPMEQQKLMYQMQIQRQLQQQQGGMQPGAQLPSQNISVQQRSMIARQQQQQQQHQQQQMQQLQQQQQQHNAQQQQQAQQSPAPQGTPNGQAPPGTPKSAHGPPGGLQPNAQRPNLDQFMTQLTVFMNRMSLPLDANPIIGDRQVHLVQLFQTVQKFNGYRNVVQGNGWPQVTAALGFPQHQIPAFAQQIRNVYERNLLKFEDFVTQSRAKANQQLQAQQQQQQQQQMHAQQQPQQLQPPPQAVQQQQSQPPQVQQQQQTQGTPLQAHQQPPQQQQQSLHHEQGDPVGIPPSTPKSDMRPSPGQRLPSGHQQPPSVVMGMGLNHAGTPNGHQALPHAPPHVNGFASPQLSASQRPRVPAKGKVARTAQNQLQNQAQAQASYLNQMQAQGRSPYAHGVPGQHPDYAAQSPAQAKMGVAPYTEGHVLPPDAVAAPPSQPQLPPLEESDEYKPKTRELQTFGGVDIYAPGKVVSDILLMRPDVPGPTELGNVDIHALTMSIQSGIHSEVRLALDTLATVTVCNVPTLDINLEHCDDLLETILEYAEELVDLLADNTAEVSDEILIPPYEDISRACQIERLLPRDDPEYGSQEEELNRAVDYLLCITTIFRNLSFNPHNQACLADETAIKFLSQVIRYAGTRNMFLRTQLNMLEFMKDVIIILSNISGSVELPDREEALCLLQFLLAFAPSPLPSLADDHIFFPPYQPSLQPYLPPAVDALAKLLARDEPNRTHFRNVFSMPGAADLLTQTFALAISPIPEHFREMRPRHLPPLLEARKPMLMQGLLAADIVASLAPGPESGVARAWLLAENQFPQNLHRTVRDLCRQYESVEIMYRQQMPFPGRGRPPPPPLKDAELMYIVVLAISMLRRLSEKAVDPCDPACQKLPPSVLPSEDSLLEALEMISGEWGRDGFLRNLVSFASLET